MRVERAGVGAVDLFRHDIALPLFRIVSGAPHGAGNRSPTQQAVQECAIGDLLPSSDSAASGESSALFVRGGEQTLEDTFMNYYES